MLLCGNNLNDLDSISKAICNLKLKSIINVSATDVSLSGKSLKINTLYLQNDIHFDNLIICDSNFKIDTRTQNYPQWIKYNLNHIPIDIFLNDINNVFIYDIDPSSIAFNNNYNNLINTPYINDVIDMNYMYLNEQQFYDIFSTNIDRVLNLISYSHCNLIENMTFDEMLYENLNISYMNVADKAIINTEFLTYYDDLYIADLTHDGVTKLYSFDTYSSQIFNNLQNSKYLSIAYNLLMQQYLSKNDSFLDSINIIITNMNDNSDLFVTNLLQMNNLDIALSNLNLFRLYNDVILTSLSLELSNLYFDFNQTNRLTCTNIINFFRVSDYGFIAHNSDGNLIMFDKSSFNEVYDNLFVIRILDDIESYSTTDSFKSSLYLDYFHENDLILQTIYDIIDSTFINLTNASTALLRTKMNLSEISLKSSNYILETYDTLNLHSISYDNEYNNLINKPTNISSFSNNSGFIHENFDLINPYFARKLLGINSLGLQNIDDVFMEGTELNLDFLNITNNLLLQQDEDNFECLLQYGSNTSRWTFIPEYSLESSNTKGMTLMYDNINYTHENNYDLYQTAENDINSTYSIRLLYDLHYYFDSIINEVQTLVNDIRNMYNIQKPSNKNKFKYSINVDNLYVIDFNISIVSLSSQYSILNKTVVKLSHDKVRKHIQIATSILTISIISNDIIYHSVIKSPSEFEIFFEFDLPDSAFLNENVLNFKVSFDFNYSSYSRSLYFSINANNLMILDEYDSLPLQTVIPIIENIYNDQRTLYSLISTLVYINEFVKLKPLDISIYEPFNYDKFIFNLNFNMELCLYFDIIICKFDLTEIIHLSNIDNVYLSFEVFNELNSESVVFFENINISSERIVFINFTRNTHPILETVFDNLVETFIKVHVSFDFNQTYFTNFHHIQNSKYFAISVNPEKKMLNCIEIQKSDIILNKNVINFPTFFSDTVNQLIIKDGIDNDLLITTVKPEYYYHTVIYDSVESEYETVNIPIIGFEFEILNFTVNSYYIYVEFIYNIRNQSIFSNNLDLTIYVSNDIDVFVLKRIYNLIGSNSISCILVNQKSPEHISLFYEGGTKSLVFKTHYNI